MSKSSSVFKGMFIILLIVELFISGLALGPLAPLIKNGYLTLGIKFPRATELFFNLADFWIGYLLFILMIFIAITDWKLGIDHRYSRLNVLVFIFSTVLLFFVGFALILPVIVADGPLGTH